MFHSPLMIACEEDWDKVIDLLLSKGASVALKNKVQVHPFTVRMCT